MRAVWTDQDDSAWVGAWRVLAVGSLAPFRGCFWRARVPAQTSCDVVDAIPHLGDANITGHLHDPHDLVEPAAEPLRVRPVPVIDRRIDHRQELHLLPLLE